MPASIPRRSRSIMILEQPGREQPELAINKKLGERDNSTVYLSPGKRVIKAMEAFYTVADLRNHMPARI